MSTQDLNLNFVRNLAEELLQEDGFFCFKCKLTFTTQQELDQHMGAIHVKKFHCDQCDKSYGRSSDLKKHKEIKHEGLRFLCSQCDRFFSRQWLLKKHVQFVHEGLDLSEACDQCDKKFATKSNLRNHKTAVHGGIVYACDECPKQFTFIYNLKKHRDTVHRRIRYICTICFKVHKDKKSLIDHAKEHAAKVKCEPILQG